MFPKDRDDVFKYLALSTTQRYSVHCYKGVRKPEHFHFSEVGMFLTTNQLTVAALLWGC